MRHYGCASTRPFATCILLTLLRSAYCHVRRPLTLRSCSRQHKPLIASNSYDTSFQLDPRDNAQVIAKRVFRTIVHNTLTFNAMTFCRLYPSNKANSLFQFWLRSDLQFKGNNPPKCIDTHRQVDTVKHLISACERTSIIVNTELRNSKLNLKGNQRLKSLIFNICHTYKPFSGSSLKDPLFTSTFCVCLSTNRAYA